MAHGSVEEIIRLAEQQKAKRTADMPTEKEALAVMLQAYLRLTELGWNNAIYCPKDGTRVCFIEAGSTGIFQGSYQGRWPDGHFLLEDGGDIYPSHPILYKAQEVAG